MRIIRCLTHLASVLAVALPASAQPAGQSNDRPLKLEASYVFSRAFESDFSESAPLGFNLAASRALTRGDSVSLGVSAAYRLLVVNKPEDSSARVSNLLGGPEVLWHRSGASPFVRGIVGVTWYHFSFLAESIRFQGTQNAMVYGGEGGVQIPWRGKSHVALTASIYRRAFRIERSTATVFELGAGYGWSFRN